MAASRSVTIDEPVRYIAGQPSPADYASVQIMNMQFRLALVLVLFLIAGCGQKGPLYLPGNPSRINTEVPPQQQTQAEEDDEEKEKESKDE